MHKVNDRHFSHARHHPWQLVTALMDALEPGALVADVNCVKGKYLGVNPQVCVIRSDRSNPLLTCSAASMCVAFALAVIAIQALY